MPRDLETIVLKAITKEPAGRYLTAEALEEDLRRFLTDRPIHARRSTVWRRTWRWCRRNPALAGLMAALALTFLAGFAGVAWKWREAEQAREAEGLARKEADDRALEIEQGLEGLKAANALLDRGRWYVGEHRVGRRPRRLHEGRPVAPDHVSVWVERGDLYTRLGLWDLAAADFAREMELREPDTTFALVSARAVALLRRRRRRLPPGLPEDAPALQRDPATGISSSEVIRAHLLAPAPTPTSRHSWIWHENVVAHVPRILVFLYLLGTGSLPRRTIRAGGPAAAESRCWRQPDWAVRALSYPVLAMAHHRLGQAAQARQALDAAAEVHRPVDPGQVPEPGGTLARRTRGRRPSGRSPGGTGWSASSTTARPRC